MSQCDDNQKSKKAIWFVVAIVIIIAIPFVLNALIQLPRFTEIVGGETDWLAFHGSYIGAIVGAGISFIIMYRTLKYYKKADEYRHNLEWLNGFRKACADYLEAFNNSNVLSIIDEMTIDAYKAYGHCETYLKQLINQETIMALYVVNSKDEKLLSLNKNLDGFQKQYKNRFLDIQKTVFQVYHASQIYDFDYSVDVNDLVSGTSKEYNELITKYMNANNRISLPQLYRVLRQWTREMDNVYNDIADSCKQCIILKSEEIEKIKQ